MKHLLFILCSFLILSTGCDEENDLNNFLIYDDGTAQIYLENVLEGRCPLNVVCFWEGNAEVQMLMMINGQSINFSLNTAGSYLNNTSVLGYDITLLDVNPYPIEGIPQPAIEDYLIDLDIN